MVTGGTRGIGWAIARRLVQAGASLVVTGTADQGPPALTDMGDGVDYWPLDLTNQNAVETICARVKEMEQLDILVNNAGINQIAAAHDVSAAMYDRVHRVDLLGPFLLSGAAIPGMRRTGWGRIVNIASIWSTITKPGRAMYATSKAGLVGLTRTLAVENAEYGILVNAVSPGFTLTELTASTLSPEEMRHLASQVPARRLASPDELAEVVTFLCSPLNTYLTAQNVTVDGGFTSI